MQMCDGPLQNIFQPRIVALRVDGVNIVCDVIYRQVFQADRCGHGARIVYMFGGDIRSR